MSFSALLNKAVVNLVGSLIKTLKMSRKSVEKDLHPLDKNLSQEKQKQAVAMSHWAHDSNESYKMLILIFNVGSTKDL